MKAFLMAMLGLCLYGSAAAQLPRSLYVVNGLAETLSKINLENGTVANHVVTLGVAPNQVVVAKTTAYVVNSISSEIQKINLATDSTTGTIFLGAGRNPWNLVLADSQKGYVTNFAANTISKIDVEGDTVLGEFPIGLSPEGLLFHQGKLFVCNTGFNPNDFSYGPGTVAVFDPASDTVVAVINVGKNPQSIRRDLGGRLQVICTGDYFSVFGMVYILNPQTFTVQDSLPLGGTPNQVGIVWEGTAFVPAGGFVVNGLVYSYQTENDSILHDSSNPILTDVGATDVAVDKYANAYIACFSASSVKKLDTLGNASATYLVGDGPVSVAVYDPRPNGDATGNNSISLADPVMVIGYIFRGMPTPVGSLAYADCNCDGALTLADAIWTINYIFKYGPLPCEF